MNIRLSIHERFKTFVYGIFSFIFFNALIKIDKLCVGYAIRIKKMSDTYIIENTTLVLGSIISVMLILKSKRMDEANISNNKLYIPFISFMIANSFKICMLGKIDVFSILLFSLCSVTSFATFGIDTVHSVIVNLRELDKVETSTDSIEEEEEAEEETEEAEEAEEETEETEEETEETEEAEEETEEAEEETEEAEEETEEAEAEETEDDTETVEESAEQKDTEQKDTEQKDTEQVKESTKQEDQSSTDNTSEETVAPQLDRLEMLDSSGIVTSGSE